MHVNVSVCLCVYLKKSVIRECVYQPTTQNRRRRLWAEGSCRWSGGWHREGALQDLRSLLPHLPSSVFLLFSSCCCCTCAAAPKALDEIPRRPVRCLRPAPSSGLHSSLSIRRPSFSLLLSCAEHAVRESETRATATSSLSLSLSLSLSFF